MPNNVLTDEKWEAIYAFLDAHPRLQTCNEAAVRRFVEGVFWIARNGARWRALPEAYGGWNSVYKRFARWCERGVWAALLTHLAQDPELLADLENVLMDATAVRAHPCAAGAPAKRGGKASKRLAAAPAALAASSTPPPKRWATP